MLNLSINEYPVTFWENFCTKKQAAYITWCINEFKHWL